MIVEVERGINNEISHLRAGMPPVPGIPNFVMEKKEPKVANGKEEFADNVEINAEPDFEEEYDESEEDEGITEFEEDKDEIIENMEETRKPTTIGFSETNVETDDIDELSSIETEKIPENQNLTFDNISTSRKNLTEGMELKSALMPEK